MASDLERLRIDYDGPTLAAAEAGDDPMRMFATWFDAARADDRVYEANAAALGTCATDGTPSVRMVLVKSIDPPSAAFGWYTSLDSRKARELAAGSGIAALTWWWPGLARQVRAVGPARRVDDATADAYFAGRPLAAQVAACASHQSRAVAGRRQLEQRVEEMLARLPPDGAPHRPAGWGGLVLVADELEFWQGRGGRQHDRVAFLRLDDDGSIRASAAVDAAGGEEHVRACGVQVADPHGTRWLRVRLEP